MPHMGHGPQTSPKRYVSDLFEKSAHIIVTYLSKLLSKLCFPDGEFENQLMVQKQWALHL